MTGNEKFDLLNSWANKLTESLVETETFDVSTITANELLERIGNRRYLKSTIAELRAEAGCKALE